MNIEINAREKKTILNNKIFKVIIGLSILIMLVVAGISLYVGWNLTTPKREVLKDTPLSYGLLYEDVEFNCKKDGVLLKGWWMPAQVNKKIQDSKKTIVFSHGYGDSRGLYDINVINLAKRLNNDGYNVLAYDFRASGESEGKFASIGALEKYDLLSAIDFVKNNKESENIGIIGWSMGATTSILAGSESNNIVQAIVADSPFANLKPYIETNLPYWSGLPNIPFTSIILKTLPLMRGINIDDVNAVKAANLLENKKLLLIHSKDDDAIPFKNSEDIYEGVKDKNNASIWLTEKAKHIRSYLLYKEEYENRIVKFFNETLK